MCRCWLIVPVLFSLMWLLMNVKGLALFVALASLSLLCGGFFWMGTQYQKMEDENDPK